MQRFILVHEDAIRADHPVFAEAGKDAYPFFVWDNHYWQQVHYSFKRLFFIYEAVSALRIKTYYASIEEVLASLFTSYPDAVLYIPHSPNPLLKRWITLAQHYTSNIHVIEDNHLVNMPEDKVFTRFFTYWKKVRAQVMKIC
jgi:hypothetical protein